MEIKVYGMYCKDYDITFIVEDTYVEKNGIPELVSRSLKGWYHGEPEEQYNKQFYGKLSCFYPAIH